VTDELELGPDLLRKLEFLRVVSRRLHTGRFAALTRSRKLGRGIDFADHRPYTPGDDFKDIDWNLYGRMDRLMIRLAEEETELNLHLMVDCSRSMSAPFGGISGEGEGLSKADYARRVATALSYIALAHLDRAHVWPFGAGLMKPLSPPRHKAQAIQIHRYLGKIEAGEGTDLEAAARALVSVTHTRGIVLVISDFLDPSGWQSGLDVLRHARFEVGMLQVSAPEDADVPARGEVVLVDPETGKRMRVRVTERIAAAYRKAFAEHGESLQRYARAHNLFYGHARSDSPFEEMVLRTMRAERLLG
jgi:uncharacterized protein (DUF58 family)